MHNRPDRGSTGRRYRPYGGTGRSGRRSATSASASLATGTAPAYAVAIGTDAAERRFGNNPGSSLDEKKFDIRNPGDVWSIASRRIPPHGR